MRGCGGPCDHCGTCNARPEANTAAKCTCLTLGLVFDSQHPPLSGRTQSPCWRKGPPEKNTLCNACGARWLVRALLPLSTLIVNLAIDTRAVRARRVSMIRCSIACASCLHVPACSIGTGEEEPGQLLARLHQLTQGAAKLCTKATHEAPQAAVQHICAIPGSRDGSAAARRRFQGQQEAKVRAEG